jgi:hypothetical protein
MRRTIRRDWLMYNQFRHYLTGVSTLMFLIFSPVAAAQSQDSDIGPKPLFASHDLLPVHVEIPITTLMKKRPEEEYLDGKFSYQEAGGTEQALDLKVRTRGRYRRERKTCNLPPIRLNFRKGQVKETEFAGQDKLKLVTHCQPTIARYEQLVLKEYLAYRILQTLTDYSFRVRLMHITYVDTDEKAATITRYGFVIEDDDDVAERLGLEILVSDGISYANLDPRQTNLIAVYEYMIGNTDFSMIRGPANDDCCHNSVPFSGAENGIMPIPYDFDFSGIVNAPYAEPNPQLKMRNVRQRKYRGRCANNEHLEETFSLLEQKQTEIRALVAAIPDLTPKYVKEVNGYLDDFYEDISTEKGIDRNFIRDCS